MSEENLPLVEVIASGYEWTCPECGGLNVVYESRLVYYCTLCGIKVVTSGSPEHCFG